MNTKAGFLYVASGDSSFAEAANSARRVRELLPDYPIALVTERERENAGVFNEIRVLPTPMGHCGDKIAGMGMSPFRATFFLDTDTYLADDPTDAFQLLRRFPLAVSHAPYRDAHRLEGVPEAFPELNTGVLLFRQGEEWQQFQQSWSRVYEEMATKPDQPSFRRALWESDLGFAVLTPEYQFRTILPCFAGEGASVKVIHGRHRDPGSLARDLNDSRSARVYLPTLRTVLGRQVVSEGRLYRWLRRLQRR